MFCRLAIRGTLSNGVQAMVAPSSATLFPQLCSNSHVVIPSRLPFKENIKFCHVMKVVKIITHMSYTASSATNFIYSPFLNILLLLFPQPSWSRKKLLKLILTSNSVTRNYLQCLQIVKKSRTSNLRLLLSDKLLLLRRDLSFLVLSRQFVLHLLPRSLNLHYHEHLQRDSSAHLPYLNGNLGKMVATLAHEATALRPESRECPHHQTTVQLHHVSVQVYLLAALVPTSLQILVIACAAIAAPNS